MKRKRMLFLIFFFKYICISSLPWCIRNNNVTSIKMINLWVLASLISTPKPSSTSHITYVQHLIAVFYFYYFLLAPSHIHRNMFYRRWWISEQESKNEIKNWLWKSIAECSAQLSAQSINTCVRVCVIVWGHECVCVCMLWQIENCINAKKSLEWWIKLKEYWENKKLLVGYFATAATAHSCCYFCLSFCTWNFSLDNKFSAHVGSKQAATYKEKKSIKFWYYKFLFLPCHSF
jgi:hypothetical protein